MSKSKAYRYAYRSIQHGGGRVELFGTDRKMSPDELEQMRRRLNRANVCHVFISRLWIVDKTLTPVASSFSSKLPKEPMFEVVA